MCEGGRFITHCHWHSLVTSIILLPFQDEAWLMLTYGTGRQVHQSFPVAVVVQTLLPFYHSFIMFVVLLPCHYKSSTVFTGHCSNTGEAFRFITHSLSLMLGTCCHFIAHSSCLPSYCRVILYLPWCYLDTTQTRERLIGSLLAVASSSWTRSVCLQGTRGSSQGCQLSRLLQVHAPHTSH